MYLLSYGLLKTLINSINQSKLESSNLVFLLLFGTQLGYICIIFYRALTDISEIFICMSEQNLMSEVYANLQIYSHASRKSGSDEIASVCNL